MPKYYSAKARTAKIPLDVVRGLTPARAVSAANQIVEEIREDLLKGRFTAGEFLGTEGSLAAHFKVGRSPIRDALRSLEAMGIIEIRVGLRGGAYVARGNPDLFAEVLAIQLKLVGVTLEELLYAIWAVEGMALDLALEKATKDDIEELGKLLAGLRPLLKRPQKFVTHSLDFHAALVRISHSRALIAQATMLRAILFKHYARIVTIRVARDVFESLAKLVLQMRLGSHDGARAQLSEHYRMARAFLLATSPTAKRAQGNRHHRTARRHARPHGAK